MQDKDRSGNYQALVIIPAGLKNDTARGLRDGSGPLIPLHSGR